MTNPPSFLRHPPYDDNALVYDIRPMQLPSPLPLPYDDSPDFAGIVDPNEEFGDPREIWYDETDMAQLQHQQEQAQLLQQWKDMHPNNSNEPPPANWFDPGTAEDAQRHAYFGTHFDVKRRFWSPNDAENDTCIAPKWTRTIHPTCNTFHEFDFAFSYNAGQAKFLGYAQCGPIKSCVCRCDTQNLLLLLLACLLACFVLAEAAFFDASF